jgi:excisionase family DNA binding protein
MHRQAPQPPTRWLTLTEAAEALRVHPTTLRRWADSGQIKVFLTPGGHRRFAESDIQQMATRRTSLRDDAEVERIWAEQALAHAREHLGTQEGEQWLKRHDAPARDRGREMGKQLIQFIIENVAGEANEAEMLEKARRIGHQYGETSRALSLTRSDALRAATFFRHSLTTSAVQLPGDLHISTEAQVRILARIDRILNEVQLGVAEAYPAS